MIKAIFHNILQWVYSLSSVPFIKKTKDRKTGIEIFLHFPFSAFATYVFLNMDCMLIIIGKMKWGFKVLKVRLYFLYAGVVYNFLPLSLVLYSSFNTSKHSFLNRDVIVQFYQPADGNIRFYLSHS